MANYRGHLRGGVLAGAIVGGAYLGLQTGEIDVGASLRSEWQLFSSMLVVSGLFGLWPDVDTNSKAQDLFIGIAFISDVLLIVTGYFQAAAFLGLLAMTPILGHHRGWTHSWVAAFLVPLPILIVPYISTEEFHEAGILLYIAAVAGYLSHLLLDGLIWKRFKIRGGWR